MLRRYYTWSINKIFSALFVSYMGHFWDNELSTIHKHTCVMNVIFNINTTVVISKFKHKTIG